MAKTIFIAPATVTLQLVNAHSSDTGDFARKPVVLVPTPIQHINLPLRA